MESNRSSPLSTLIMIMPLVVVPALAILRPAEQDSGFAGDDLAAAQGVDFSEFEPSSGADDGFSRFLDSTPGPSRPNGTRLQSGINRLDAPLHDDWLGRSSLSDRPPMITPTRGRQTSTAGSEETQRRDLLLQDLKRFGVTRTVWFQPGPSSDVGLVAFVPADDGVVRYRFESIAASETDAVRGVIRDLTQWHRERSGLSGR